MLSVPPPPSRMLEPETMSCHRSHLVLLGYLSIAGLLAISPPAWALQQSSEQPVVSAPEKQPSLMVNRDPVASPDLDVSKPSGPPAKPGTGSAQTGNSNTAVRGRNGEYTLERNVDEVVLNATVLDDKHQPVASLNKDNFKVYEDGVPQTITSFEHQDIPISLGILVDNSGSMRTKRQAVNQTALDLVRASNKDDESFVVNFSDEAYIDQDFTSSVAKLRQGLSHIDSKGGTALYDAIVASADYMSKNATRPKQVLLVITDGEDNASSTTLDQTVRRIQDLQGPVIYTIGLLFDSDTGGRETHRARHALELLADETGGVAFFPRSLDEVDEIAGEVARDIREQYTLGYHSTKPMSEGGFRQVHVDAKAKGYGRLIVRTKTGYYPTSKVMTQLAPGVGNGPQNTSN